MHWCGSYMKVKMRKHTYTYITNINKTKLAINVYTKTEKSRTSIIDLNHTRGRGGKGGQSQSNKAVLNEKSNGPNWHSYQAAFCYPWHSRYPRIQNTGIPNGRHICQLVSMAHNSSLLTVLQGNENAQKTLINTFFVKPDSRCPSLVHFVNAPSGIHNVS